MGSLSAFTRIKRFNHLYLLLKKISAGGITGLKLHLAGIRGEVSKCKRVPQDVKWQMKQLIEDLTKEQERKSLLKSNISSSQFDSNNEEAQTNASDRSSENVSNDGNTEALRQKQKTRKFYFAPRTNVGAQKSIKCALSSKEMVDNAHEAMARWWYDANVQFNASNSNYYQPMIDPIAAIGPGFKAPSYHDLRGLLLKDNVHEVQEYLMGSKYKACTVWEDWNYIAAHLWWMVG